MIKTAKTRHAEGEQPEAENPIEPEKPEEPATEKKTENPRFSKDQFLKNRPRERDVLRVVLKDGEKYTKNDVDRLVNEFRTQKV